MVIRAMETRDYRAYCALLSEVHGMHAGNRPDIFKEVLVLPGEADFSQMISDEKCVCLAAEADGEVVGMCLMEIRMPRAAHVHHRQIGYIDDLCVRSDMRGRGIGSKLYEAMKERARELGLVRMELMVWAFNERAKRFYERLGMNVRSCTMEERL